MIIKIDVDGVIRNIVGAICNRYNMVFDENVMPDEITDYDINNSFPLIKEVLHKKPTDYFFIEHGREIFRDNVLPFDDPAKSISCLREAGHKVIIVTWQFTTDNKKYTLDFLDDWKIEYDDICFTRDKHLINGDIIIDDNPEFLLHSNEESLKMCINRPYNVGKCDDILKFNSLKEVTDYILNNQNSFVYLEKENTL